MAAADVLEVWVGRSCYGRYEVHARDLLIGRGGHIVVPAPGVSRLHALLSWRDGYVITDLGSTNGVKVNGQAAGEARLKDGDQLQLGDARIVCRFAPQSLGPQLMAPPLPPAEGLADTVQVTAAQVAAAAQQPGERTSVLNAAGRSASMTLSANHPARLAAESSRVSRPLPPKAPPRPEPEAPKPEAPKPEAPKPEAPKPETPAAGVPKAEAPKAEAPKAETPKAGVAKADAPKGATPKAGVAKAERPEKAEKPEKAGAKDKDKREAVGEDVKRAYETYFVRLRRLVRPDVDPAKEPKPTQVDLTYHARRTTLRKQLRRAWVVTALVAIAWIGQALGRQDRTILTSSSGVSSGHQLFGNDCAQCHVQPFRMGVPDAACLECHATLLSPHDRAAFAALTSAHPVVRAALIRSAAPEFLAARWPTHHASQARTLTCAECHVEHRGNTFLTRGVSDRHCVTCHGDLAAEVAVAGSFGVVAATGRKLASLRDHPEFAALTPAAGLPALPPGSSGRLVAAAPGAAMAQDRAKLFLNHARHLRPDLGELDSPARKAWVARTGRTRLECSDCHEPDGTGRMEPIAYERHCAACHPLGLSPLPGAERDAAYAAASPLARVRQVPHGVPPAELLAFLRGARLEEDARLFYEGYIKAHPEERKPTQSARRPGPGQKPPAEVTPEKWVDARMVRWREKGVAGLAEELLLAENKGGCVLCHVLEGPALTGAPSHPAAAYRAAVAERVPAGWAAALVAAQEQAPAVAPPAVPAAWMPRARFRHDRHQTLRCDQCHAGVEASQETTDVLLPTMASCVKCHSPEGGAPHSCTTCHGYHGEEAGSAAAHASRTVSDLLGERGR